MSNRVLELTKKLFEETASQEGILVVDCWAPWCGACEEFTPVFERIASQFPNHKFGRLNTQMETVATKKLGIEHIPTLLLYRDGILLFRQPGYFEENKLADIVEQAESLDMEMVRKQLAKQEAQEAEGVKPPAEE